MPSLNAGFPTGPLTNPVTGEMTPAWRLFLLSLYDRTGGAVGLSSANPALAAEIAAETAGRQAADTGLTNELTAEAIARTAGDNANAAAIASEAAARRADRAASIARDATAAKVFVYTQATPATSWSITHNLGMTPAVVISDSAGTLIEGDVSYPDLNNVVLSFAAGFAGTAYLI